MKAIGQKSALPIKPTEKPQPQEMATVAVAVVNVVQQSILSPAAVIATLRCAYDLYRTNALALGFNEEAATHCDNLGAQLAEAMRKSGAVKTASPIAVPDTGLVAPNGAPISSGQSLAATLAAVRNAPMPEPTYAAPPEKCRHEDCDGTTFVAGSVNSKPGWACEKCRGFHYQAEQTGAENSVSG
jgi:hypothetical protein